MGVIGKEEVGKIAVGRVENSPHGGGASLGRVWGEAVPRGAGRRGRHHFAGSVSNENVLRHMRRSAHIMGEDAGYGGRMAGRMGG